MDLTVAVTGASGFVGNAVVRALRARGARVVALGRTSEGSSGSVERRRFDPNGPPDPAAFRGAQAVVHLAGESVSGRWTPEKKRRIEASRVAGTRTLVASLAALERMPAVLVSASAIGYYGDRGDEPLVEGSRSGDGFLAHVCADWEAAARGAEALGIRTVCLRTGVVLGNGGALKEMLAPFRFGAGGPLGNGRQFVPWIHVDDLAALYCFAIENAALGGAVNAVTPDYATSARLAHAIGAALHRPSLLPAPAFALRALLGEFAQSLLGSQVVIPAAAQDAGFTWGHPELESAVAAVLHAPSGRSGIRRFTQRQFVARPLDEVFAFFSDPRNLEAITPPSLAFAFHGSPPSMVRGATIDYDLRLRGLRVNWKTMISDYRPMREFADVQLRGPYMLWRHRHEFNEVPGGVEVADSVDYLLPAPPFGELAAPLVARDLTEIFRFRRDAIERRFGTKVGGVAHRIERA